MSMQRRPNQTGAFGSDSQRAAETGRSLLERENESHMDDLQAQASIKHPMYPIPANGVGCAQVAALKELTIDIGDEVKQQNALIDNMVRPPPPPPMPHHIARRSTHILAPAQPHRHDC